MVTCAGPLTWTALGSGLVVAAGIGLVTATKAQGMSFGAAYAFYATWFISVWCFFAALLSAVVYLHFSVRDLNRSRSNDNSLSAHRSQEA